MHVKWWMMRRKTVLDMAFHHFSRSPCAIPFVVFSLSCVLRNRRVYDHRAQTLNSIQLDEGKIYTSFRFSSAHLSHCSGKRSRERAHCVCYTMKGMNCLIRSSETEWNCLYVKIAQSSFVARLLPISTLRVFLFPLLSLSPACTSFASLWAIQFCIFALSFCSPFHVSQNVRLPTTFHYTSDKWYQTDLHRIKHRQRPTDDRRRREEYIIEFFVISTVVRSSSMHFSWLCYLRHIHTSAWGVPTT